MKPEIRERSQQLLRDERLQKNLSSALSHTRTRRAELISENPDWQNWRERASASRIKTLENLPKLLEQASQQLRNNGAQVHLAHDAAEAREICANILQQAEAHFVVKGKSMVTEEIGLNDLLQARGIEVWEGDLGELIVQMRDEPPTHITAPALHLDRGQIAELFRQEMQDADLQQALDEAGDDPSQLTSIARRFMRQKFLQADAGITGANFVIADTGSVVLVENESNIRLATSLPNLHIAITGIERLVPSILDLPEMMGLLPVSATGQIISSAVSILGGPRAKNEVDGPQEMHVIFVDNGRRELLADPLLRPALQCIRCGACLNVCPVFRRLGGHGYGAVYPGPIGSVLSPALLGTKDDGAHAFACTLCGACDEDCPMQVPLSQMILGLRQRAQQRRPANLERAGHQFFAILTERPGLFAIASASVTTLGQIWPTGWSSPLALGWNDGRTLPRRLKLKLDDILDQECKPADQNQKTPENIRNPAEKHQNPATLQAILAKSLRDNDTVFEFCADENEAQKWFTQRRDSLQTNLESAPGFELFGEVEAAALIASTGTLVFTGRQARELGQGRQASLTCRHLLARVKKASIFSNLQDYLQNKVVEDSLVENMHKNQGSFLLLISGPSRTADIEKILVMPAHGPATLSLAIIDDD